MIYRTIDSDNICKFKFDFNTIFLDSLSEVDDAPSAFELFHTQFQDLYNKHFPIKHKTVTRKSLLKPWITSTLANRIKIKDKMGLLSKKGRVDRKVYTDFRDLVDKQVKKVKIYIS